MIEQSFCIGKRKVGDGHPSFIVAEISCNHHGSFDKAVRLIKAAAKAKADAVKFQTYTADTMTIDSSKEWFLVGGKDNPSAWQKKTLYELYKEAYTPWEWQPKLKKIAENEGLIFFSTPFDESAVDFLEEIHVLCYKIAAYEANHIPLIRKAAKTKKPLIISVGYASLSEVQLAVSIVRNYSDAGLALLHCVTSYTHIPEKKSFHLYKIKHLHHHFEAVAGFSDNNGGVEIPVLAVIAGASIVEKHLILDRKERGHIDDAEFSLEPNEFAEMVRRIREIEQILGEAKYGPLNKTEEYNIRWRRSLFIVKDIKKGEVFTRENVRSIRPGFGLPPSSIDGIVGKKASCDIERGTPLSWKFIDNN